MKKLIETELRWIHKIVRLDICYFNVLVFFLILIYADITWAARQNLDEAMARKLRYSTATFYAGPQASPYYFWQPETLNYTDTNYGTEVWRVTYKPDAADDFSNEYSTQAWSHDGSRLGFRTIVSTGITAGRSSNDPNKDSGTSPRWTVNSDGSKMRVGTGGGSGHDYLNWLNTESAYLFTPRSTGEFSGALTNSLYKVTLDSNNSMTRVKLLDGIGGAGLKSSLIKDPITSDDKWMVLMNESIYSWPTPNPISSTKISFINLSSNTIGSSWGVARGIGPASGAYCGLKPEWEVKFRGSSSAFINGSIPTLYAHYHNYVPHMIFKMAGSASDGGPAWADWNGSTFGANEEIKALDDNAKLSYGLPHNPYDNGYVGHPEFDRWGHYVLVNNNHDCNDVVYGSSPPRFIRWGNKACPGLLVLDVTNNLANPSWVDANNSNYMLGTGVNNTIYGASHSSWKGWTDNIVSMNGYTFDLYQNNYKKTVQTGKTNTQASKYLVSTELAPYHDNYASFPRPSQSPDGTKVAFSTILFASQYKGTSSDDDRLGISYVVANYPYPPEINSATKSGANVRLTWDFNQGTVSSPNYTSPRTYTKRGWPNETADLPPSPREIKQFRVWRLADNLKWKPLDEIPVPYNNRGGKWTETSWTYEAAQPVNSTRYYAITSLEHSGLESRTLSNIWKVILDSDGNITQQSQASAYPSDPGSKSNFYTSMPVSPSDVVFAHKLAPAISNGQYTITWKAPSINNLIRFYNIYAADGTVPSAIQQRRIASIPATSDYAGTGNFKYVDWLGNVDGSSKYTVTAVDFQGNESPVIPTGAPKSPTGVKGQRLP